MQILYLYLYRKCIKFGSLFYNPMIRSTDKRWVKSGFFRTPHIFEFPLKPFITLILNKGSKYFIKSTNKLLCQFGV